MRSMLAAVAALSLLAVPAGEAVAKKDAKKQKAYASRAQEPRPRSGGADAYVVRDANKLPFGSAIWWDQMQREGRLGGEVP
jgi:hypothetical protein